MSTKPRFKRSKSKTRHKLAASPSICPSRYSQQLKEDLKAYPAEMVYGEPLRIPGEFFVTDKQNDPVDVINQLRRQMETLQPTPVTKHGQPGTFVFKELASCTHVFLRDDTVRSALKPPYSGPHQVIRRDDKTITLLIRGKEARFSIDRVKPAFILSTDPHSGQNTSPSITEEKTPTQVPSRNKKSSKHQLIRILQPARSDLSNFTNP